MTLRPNRKPLLLGMNNPISDEPEYDLYSYPKHSTGWRLWQMLPEGTTRAQYHMAFERRNLLHSRKWSAAEARKAGEEMLPMLSGRLVVVLGTAVRSALRLQKAEPLSLHSVELSDGTSFAWLAFPHPSGRNVWFHNKQNYRTASNALTLLARKPVDERVVKLLQEMA